MDGHRFDEIARQLAASSTRRRFLKTALVAAGAGALSRVRPASARPARDPKPCKKNSDCPTEGRCETSSGICCAQGPINEYTCCRPDQIQANVSWVNDGAKFMCCPAGSSSEALEERNGKPVCCPRGTTCRHANKCCEEDQVCAQGDGDGTRGACCPAGSARETCDGKCRPEGTVCATDGHRKKICPAGSKPELVNGKCCPVENVTASDEKKHLCCPPDASTSLCGGKCCGADRECCRGHCCPSGHGCDDRGHCEACLDGSHLCGENCCPDGRTCCNHVCCAAGSTCGSNGCEATGVEVNVPAINGSVATGVNLSAGDRVTIFATGLISYGSGLQGSSCQCGGGPCIGPNGCGEEGTCWAFEDHTEVQGACGMLVGRIGSGTPFLVGSSKTLTAASSGELILSVNDFPAEKGNNSGSFTATITVG